MPGHRRARSTPAHLPSAEDARDADRNEFGSNADRQQQLSSGGEGGAASVDPGGPPAGVWVGKVWLTPTSSGADFLAAERQGDVPYQRFRAAAKEGPQKVLDQFRAGGTRIADDGVALLE